MDRVKNPSADATAAAAAATTAAALDAFRALLAPEGQALLAELRDYDPAQALALATRLRRDHSPELVSAALAQARLRQRAAAKFGTEDAQRMYFTPNGVEQSTRKSVADYRAARFRPIVNEQHAAEQHPASPATAPTPATTPDTTTARKAPHVIDLCGGIGGDALAMARAGLHVTAVDLDPAACLAAHTNAQALLPDPAVLDVVQADVLTYDLTGADALFLDPARRSGARGRIFDPEAYSPPLSFSVAAVRKVGAGAVKIAPGIPHELVPDDFEAEWISDGGDVKEAVLWHAPPGSPHLTRGGRRATLLPSGASLLGRGLPDPDVRPVGRYLYEPDGAVIRAHLVAEVAEDLDGGLIDETIAYITADELRPTPYATPYEITDQLPFSVKKLKAVLREREVGVLTVKKRGSAVEPEELRKKMKLSGKNSATVFLTRVAGAPTMLIGHPARG
ncbi:class I SAM-dependent methyltransferase [Streptomyces sp. NBC_00237]|uniref:THUMP-like domain-containing protein n=1 Tax=Streptomyces sp. NBC_00237 TaxID=2975687 RepID=UPI002255BF8D|nr:SAM-dependent methyltransferase [Streptomyces sp. NBC_00237]MCX5204779.1 class I SAM-dependent methyltransferase [Streptomyces sp. NBC_00237]